MERAELRFCTWPYRFESLRKILRENPLRMTERDDRLGVLMNFDPVHGLTDSIAS